MTLARILIYDHYWLLELSENTPFDKFSPPLLSSHLSIPPPFLSHPSSTSISSSFSLAVEAINECIRQTGIDIVQLHGDEPPEVINQIHAPCIKVLHVTPKGQGQGLGKESLSVIDRLQQDTQAYANHAVSLLLDSRLPGD